MASLREYICWTTAPVQFRGLKVAAFGVAIMCVAGAVAFLERPSWLLVMLSLVAGLFGWVIAALGGVSQWRWFWNPQRNSVIEDERSNSSLESRRSASAAQLRR